LLIFGTILYAKINPTKLIIQKLVVFIFPKTNKKRFAIINNVKNKLISLIIILTMFFYYY